MLPLHTQLPNGSDLGRSVEESRLAEVLPRRAVARLSSWGRAMRRVVRRGTQIDHYNYPQSSSALSLRGSLESVRQIPTDMLNLFPVGFWGFLGCGSKYSRQQLFRSFVAPVRMVSQFENCLLARELSGGRLFVRFQTS